ncbi:MAG: dienelactone hydrolase family protein [Acidimicrobiaceae bacterium]|nr:dienelactone hydrolase family protein [Acidimicrobiaceae bacterium]
MSFQTTSPLKDSGIVQIETKTVTTNSGMPITLYFPDGAGQALPSVVLMHERYGLVQHTGDLARRLADEGYCVATPDLFFYISDQNALHSGAAKATPTDPYVIDRLDEVVAVLSGEPVADSGKLGMIGVCQTGRYSIIYGAKRKLNACIVLYGGISDWDQSELRPEHMADVLKQLGAPFLGLYGETDHTISIADVVKLRNVLEENDKSYRIKIFEDAPHGWLNNTMPGRYRRVAAESAMYEVVRFLKQNLSATSGRSGRVNWEFESNKDVNYDFGKNVRFE